jgi:hypothetical protein
MVDYTATAATATRLLTKFGRDLTVRNYTNESYNPATGKNVKTYSDSTVKGAVFSFGTGDSSTELIQVGDKKAIITSEVTPQLEDHLIVGTKVYIIKSVKELNPAGTSIMFELHIRNG